MSDEAQPGHVRIRLDLSYDGTGFSGWAKQAGGRRTVQGEIEDALRTVTRSGETTYELTVAGRTDAGVHARGQVAHVDLPADLWEQHREKLLKRLAGRLARDVRIWSLAEAPAGFDARFSAVWRRYAYRVTDHPGGVDPLLRGHVLWHDWPLDVDAMTEAAGRLLGRARLRRVLQAAGGGDDHPYAPGAEPGARRGRGDHGDGAGRRLCPTWCAR
ncbi:tRNA pseudouridine synthase A [Streptomyces hirsutus]